MTKRTEEEDASHRHVCEAHLKTNKSLTVNSLFTFTLFISLNFRRHVFFGSLGRTSGPEVEHRPYSGETIRLDIVKLLRVRFDGN